MAPGGHMDEVCFENTIKEVSSGESIVEEKEKCCSLSILRMTLKTTSYYRWGYSAVFEVFAPLADTSPPCDPETPPGKCGPCNEPTKTCWVTTYDNEFLKVANDESFNGKSVKGHPIYATSADRKFDIIYAANIETIFPYKRSI